MPSSPPEILGGPGWINSERYDIDAKAEGTAKSGMTQGPMLQTLLEDRFELKIHHGTKEIPVYNLSGKGRIRASAILRKGVALPTIPC
ncbi:hypothetical protein SBA3_1440008 [Candidatus Sulfopaludibacter sp. SbA3]|nr:hypothetical protein SBA3_1440008 [Candidatus Sulfopaludibacter sp. SbA3]